MTQHTREEELVMIASPDRWPWATVLPLTRYQPGSPLDKQEGFLYQPDLRTPCPPPMPVVHLANIFMIKGVPVDTVPKIRYASFGELLDDGWWID